MNNKGMTTIELITSFILASVVFIMLFNLILSLKEVYTTNNLKTKLLIEQANLSRTLNKGINGDENKSITSIQTGRFDGENEELNTQYYTFNYSDGSQKLLSVKYSDDSSDENEEITFDGFTYELDDKTKLGQISIENQSLSSDYLLIIDIPISSEEIEGNYGVRVVYRYPNSESLLLN